MSGKEFEEEGGELHRESESGDGFFFEFESSCACLLYLPGIMSVIVCEKGPHLVSRNILRPHTWYEGWVSEWAWTFHDQTVAN